MGTVTITTVGDAAYGTKTDQYNFSDEGLHRMIAWGQAAYPNEDGSPPGPNGAHNRIWGPIVRGVKDNVQRHEKVEQIEELPPVAPIP